MKFRLFFALLPGFVASASAQDITTAADSSINQPVKNNSRAIKPVTYILPSAMITYGFIALESKPLIRFNQHIKQSVWDNNPHPTTKIDDYTWFVPAVSVYALNLAGVKGKHHFADRTILYGLSYAIASVVVIPTKELTKELRPDSSNRFSFPSGHTTQAFVAAEFLRMEYKDVSPWYGIAGYAVAATTGYLRMCNNTHWFSDVVAGAGVGILSVQAAYWIYPRLKQKFAKNKKTSFLVLPYYQQQTAGVLFSYQLN
jgi:membrane-associated phospholipid phosphatase